MQPENIVLKETDGKQLKIIDFGSAQDLSINPNVKAMVGTPEFIGETIMHPLHTVHSHTHSHTCTHCAAPEVLLFDPVTSAADMW